MDELDAVVLGPPSLDGGFDTLAFVPILIPAYPRPASSSAADRIRSAVACRLVSAALG